MCVCARWAACSPLNGKLKVLLLCQSIAPVSGCAFWRSLLELAGGGAGGGWVGATLWVRANGDTYFVDVLVRFDEIHAELAQRCGGGIAKVGRYAGLHGPDVR